MAWRLKQRSVHCFCVESDSWGGSGSRQKEEMEERRTADFLQGRNTRAMENKNRRKRWDLFLSLPHSSAFTSDSHFPRALLSRFLLSLHKPSPARGGGRVEALGCRMRFRRHCSNKEKEDKKGDVEVMGEENEAEVGGRKVVGSPMSELPANGGRVPPPPDPVTVEGGTVGSGEKVETVSFGNIVIDLRVVNMTTGIKPEDVSLNLGMVIGLIFLLTKSATEFDKMVELREQMEMLVKDIKDGIQRKGQPPNYTQFGSSASNSFGNGNISNSISLRNDRASYHVQRLPGVMESAAQSECDTESGSERCLKTDQIERELEVELENLQLKLEDRVSSAFIEQDRMELTSGGECPEEGNEVEESSFHCGINPHELERRLHELLQTRQQERIAELESALDRAERMIHEKEREICWWRDTARPVSQHKDETISW